MSPCKGQGAIHAAPVATQVAVLTHASTPLSEQVVQKPATAPELVADIARWISTHYPNGESGAALTTKGCICCHTHEAGRHSEAVHMLQQAWQQELDVAVLSWPPGGLPAVHRELWRKCWTDGGRASP